jgi:prepilin-type processing-associated H-X9-DG protein
VVIYENPEYQSDGTNVAYCDGHVMWQKPEGFIKDLRMTCEKLGQPMPTVTFKKDKGKKWLKWGEKCETTQPAETHGIPFKCTNKECGEVTTYTVADIQMMNQTSSQPTTGPEMLDCPKCKKHSLTQAVKCPACEEVFIMNKNPEEMGFNDKCPKCGKSYVKAWKEKYPKRSEQE